MAHSNEGTTPALSDDHARRLLEALPEDTLKGIRDRAMWRRCFITGCAGKSSAR
jgi:site-specific recombinase XerD